MWYVIQTFGGEEEKIAHMIRKQVSPDCMEECFVPKRERMKKFHGSWNKVEEVLFCGYVFAASKRPGKLYQELKRVASLTRVLGREETYFFPLSREEERLVRGIGDCCHKTAMSRIELEEGKRIRVIDGPLKDYEGDVVRVNLHKREAVIRVEFMGKPTELFLGVEMVGRPQSAGEV